LECSGANHKGILILIVKVNCGLRWTKTAAASIICLSSMLSAQLNLSVNENSWWGQRERERQHSHISMLYYTQLLDLSCAVVENDASLLYHRVTFRSTHKKEAKRRSASSLYCPSRKSSVAIGSSDNNNLGGTSG
jgi:hypothetical protein